MKYFVVLLLPFFISFAAAASTTTACYTSNASTSVKSIRTSSSTVTKFVPVFQTIRKTPSTTTTPPTTTVTITSFSTVVSMTEQFANTRTVTSTVTEITATSFSISTISSYGPTTTTTETLVINDPGVGTIPTSSGFRPIKSTLPKEADPMKKREVGISRVNKHEKLERSSHTSKRAVTVPGGKYPSSITCYKIVTYYYYITITLTAKTTRTVAAPTPTFTSTITSPTTSVQTIMSASTTTTLTVTLSTSTVLTQISVSTTTETVTATVTNYASSTYAACAPDNAITTIFGKAISGFTMNYENYMGAAVTSAAACCNICFGQPNCVAYTYYPSLSYCFVYFNSLCTTANQSPNGEVSTDYASTSFIVGNGNCGAFTSAVNRQL